MIALHTQVHITKNTDSRQSCTQGFSLTAGDIEILRQVLEHRFLRREQLSQLLGRHEKRTHRRLLKLSSRRYLTVLRFPRQKYIYGLGRVGILALVKQGIASPNLLDERLRTRELKEFFLKHEMMIVDIHVLLTIASRQGSACLTEWREGREIYDSVRAANPNGTDRLPIRPDAFFGLQDSHRPAGANRSHFALEADRSTETQTRFVQKLRAYWTYIEQGLHETRLGAKSFRVLTITLTDERARNLCALATTVIPERGRKYFLFTSAKSLSLAAPNPIGAPTCHSARTSGSGELHPLVPKPKPLQKESISVM